MLVIYLVEIFELVYFYWAYFFDYALSLKSEAVPGSDTANVVILYIHGPFKQFLAPAQFKYYIVLILQMNSNQKGVWPSGEGAVFR